MRDFGLADPEANARYQEQAREVSDDYASIVPDWHGFILRKDAWRVGLAIGVQAEVAAVAYVYGDRQRWRTACREVVNMCAEAITGDVVLEPGLAIIGLSGALCGGDHTSVWTIADSPAPDMTVRSTRPPIFSCLKAFASGDADRAEREAVSLKGKCASKAFSKAETVRADPFADAMLAFLGRDKKGFDFASSTSESLARAYVDRELQRWKTDKSTRLSPLDFIDFPMLALSLMSLAVDTSSPPCAFFDATWASTSPEEDA